MFDDKVHFRAMTPNHTWEARTPAAVIDDVILGTWFASSDSIELVEGYAKHFRAGSADTGEGI